MAKVHAPSIVVMVYYTTVLCVFGGVSTLLAT